MPISRRSVVIASLAGAILLAPASAGAQATAPGLSPGGINGAVGGGPAAGAVAIPPPPAATPMARPGIPTVTPYTPSFGARQQTYGSGARALPEGTYVPRRKHRRKRH